MRPPDGGVSAFVEFPQHPDVTGLCRDLAERHRVLMVPGVCFGDDFQRFARLGFGGTETELTAGLSCVEQLVRDNLRMGTGVTS